MSEIKLILDLSKVKRKVIPFPVANKAISYAIAPEGAGYRLTVQLVKGQKSLLVTKEQLVEFFSKI
jgi:hypothetical protein